MIVRGASVGGIGFRGWGGPSFDYDERVQTMTTSSSKKSRRVAAPCGGAVATPSQVGSFSSAPASESPSTLSAADETHFPSSSSRQWTFGDRARYYWNMFTTRKKGKNHFNI